MHSFGYSETTQVALRSFTFRVISLVIAMSMKKVQEYTWFYTDDTNLGDKSGEFKSPYYFFGHILGAITIGFLCDTFLRKQM